MKLYDVIVERHNGVYRATVPTLPNLSAEGATRDEAVAQAKNAIEEFFKSVELATVAVEVPGNGFPYAERWLHQAGISRKDPADPLYQEFLAELAREKQRQRKEAEREAEEELIESSSPMNPRSPRNWIETAGMFVGDEEAMQQHIEEIYAERRRQREEVERELDRLDAGEGGR